MEELMAHSYPHTETFDSNAKTLTFEDGFEVEVPDGAFSEPVEVTIDKLDDRPGNAVTDIYTFRVASGQAPSLSKDLMLRVPSFVNLTVATALSLRGRDPGDIGVPNPESWTPRGPSNPHDGIIKSTMSELGDFYVSKGE
jgi:hypothetical protein